MGTWIKETDKAIYLMQGGTWISRITKSPSTADPKEQVLDIAGMKAWFSRSDAPQAMTIAVGIGALDPNPVPTQPQPPPVTPPETGSGGSSSGSSTSSHAGMHIRVLSDTYFKLELKNASELAETQKAVVKKGTILPIQYYTEVGSNHWQLQLLEPSIGNNTTKSWYAYTPDIELVSETTLTVISDTLFKHEPKLSSELPSDQKLFVKNKTLFKLVSHLPAQNSHTKVELSDAALGPNEDKVWYAYTPDIKIAGNRQSLKALSDTIFKLKPEMSSALSNDEKVFVKKGTVFEVSSYGQPEKNHIKVALNGAFLGPQNRNTWYIFVPDISITGTEIGNKPNDSNSSSNPQQPANPADRGIPLKFPGFDGTYYSNDPIMWETQYGEKGNFTWGEAVHADSSGHYRKPANSDVVYGILRVAKVMEDIRRRYGNKPIQINSWYRDPATNAAVGGASQSRHLVGDATDFVVPGVHPYDVYADLDKWWGTQGGLASSTVFTHIDTRGYKARWDYGY